MKQILASAAVAASVLLAPAASAHQIWLNTTRFHSETARGAEGPLSAGVAYVGWGHRFPADGLPPADAVAPILLHGGGEARPLERSEEGFLTAPISVPAPGAYILTTSHAGGFFTMYKEEGAVKHTPASKEGLDDVLSSQYFEMTAKALFAVGDTDSNAFTEPVGQTVEIVPQTNPYRLVAGSETKLPVQVLLRGEPAAGAAVTVYHAAQVPGDEFVERLTADTEGAVEIALDREGVWMIVAVARTPLREEFEGKADEESYTASLTFEAQQQRGENGGREY